MTATDIAVQPEVTALDRLPPEQREFAITGVLSQACDLLALAEVATDPAREVAQVRALVSTVSEMSKRLGVSKKLKQDAEVMVRRSERALGKAIRKGQENGEIVATRSGGGPKSDYQRNGKTVSVDLGVNSNQIKSTPTDFAGKYDLTNSQGGIYDMTDEVTDAEFEEALTEAQEESNVSRANVVRKIKDRKTSEEREDQWGEVEKLIKRAMTSDQINAKLGMYAQASTFRAKAKERGLTFPADKIARRSNFSTERVLNSLASEMNATAMAHPLMSYEDVTKEEAEELLERINPGFKALKKIINSLKEITK